MGSASSKFRKHILNGDEYAAMQVFQNSPELRKSLDPNLSYGDQFQHNTAIHLVSKHGMKHLLRIFLTELHGNPNKRNFKNETALHCTCNLPLNASPSAQERRLACAQIILQWKGKELIDTSSGIERADLKAQDTNGNTPLHIAAASGLKRIVELLVSHGAPLFLENTERLTPCDVAMKANFHDIALYLESRMVFADVLTELEPGLRDQSFTNDHQYEGQSSKNAGGQYEDFDEVYTGLRAQDLQEAKDQLVVETADMLHIPLFTAEALLRDNEWSREMLLEKWMADPIDCCESMGLQTPLSALRHGNSSFGETGATLEASLEYLEAPPTSPCKSRLSSDQTEDILKDSCEICLEVMDEIGSRIFIPCDHNFCRECWSNYLTLKISEGVHHVTCPALGCSFLVPVEQIESLVSKETARKYLHFDLNSFVATNPSIKWCPKPGCGRAVKLPENEQEQSNVLNMFTTKCPTRTSHAVDCGNGHFFCWECLSEAHAPSGCDQWLQWLQKVAEVRPEELKSTCTDSEDAANCYWLVTNCKVCPNCKSPIQKNEGCNHMKCSKCKFDFCWVCLDSWKKHSSATGGYFRCNRYEAMHKADEKQGSLISEAGQRNKKLQELNRFIHYYTRYKNHDNSRLLEEPLLLTARRKMGLLAASLPAARSAVVGRCDLNENGALASTNDQQPPASTRFIEEGIRELIKARRILCGSYVFGYYLEDNGYNKTIFEFMQNELESLTEKLSEMVARPYLRTPRSAVVDMTLKVRRKRHEFMRAVSKGLIPPETPPALRKVRRRRFPGLMGLDHTAEEEEITEAIAASLKHLDPSNPWVKDSQGRHTNLSAIYDWPDANSDEEDSGVNQALTVSLLGVCDREGCGRPRARNPRTGKVHSFCSLRCSRHESQDQLPVVTTDFAMDLVIALEMSRLQLIEDQVRNQQRSQPSTSSSESRTAPMQDYSEEAQLRLAIHLSLTESRKKECEASSSIPSTSAANASADMGGVANLKICKQELNCLSFNDAVTSTDDSTDRCATKFEPTQSCGDREGRFEISELHQNAEFFSSSLGEEQHPDTASDGAISSLPFSKRCHSACDIRTGKFRCSSLDLEPHECSNCVHEHVEGISQGPPTRTLLRLQSLGTDYGSDEFGGCTSCEETGQSKEEDTPTKDFTLGKPKLTRQKNITRKMNPADTLEKLALFESGESCDSECTLPTPGDENHPYNQGIPRSPTLYISGVAISCTPEQNASVELPSTDKEVVAPEQAVKTVRSSSLTASSVIHLAIPQQVTGSIGRGRSKSAGRLNNSNATNLNSTQDAVCPTIRNKKENRKHVRRLTMPGSTGPGSFGTAPLSPFPLPSPRVLSRSACEPQREKEIFSFPKSPTESQLSSVLLVRDCNTRDAFHEALFLPRSPREQRRKRSKKSSVASASSTSALVEPKEQLLIDTHSENNP